MNFDLEEFEVGDQTGRDRADIKVGESDKEQGEPSEVRMVMVQTRHPGPELVANRVLGEVLQPTTDRVTTRMAGKRVEPEQRSVDQEHQSADLHVTPLALAISKSDDRVVGQDHVENQSCIKEPAVSVLANQRCASLTRVLGLWFSNRAGGRRLPEGAVVGLPVVVTSKPKTEREDQDDQRRWQSPPEADRLPEGA